MARAAAKKPETEDEDKGSQTPAIDPGASTKEVALAPGALPSFLADKIKEDEGKGVSTLAEDNLVPLIYVLQAQSPQCNKRSPDYVEGAEAGAIWLRGSGLPAIPGETGMLFQPCYFYKDWVEWIPRAAGGGFVGRHDDKPAEAVETPDPQNPEKKRWMLPNGHEVKETRYHIGNVILGPNNALPYVIPLSGSGHTVSKNWMALMNGKSVGGARAPSWAALYRLKTKQRSNAQGEWMTFEVTDAGWVQTEADYKRGADLNAAFASGEKRVEVPEPAMEGDNGAM